MHVNACKMTFSSAPGTGSISGLTAVSGFPTLAQHDGLTGMNLSYSIIDSAGAFVEDGVGHYDGTNWVRDRPDQVYSGGIITQSGTAANIGSGTYTLVVGTPHAGSLWAKRPYVLSGFGVKGYSSPCSLSSVANAAVAVGRVYWEYVYPVVDEDIDGVVISVATAGAAGKVFRGGVFDIGSNGFPGQLIRSGGTVAVDTTGTKVSSFARWRPSGPFAVGIVFDGTPSIASGGSILSGFQAGMQSNGVAPYGQFYSIGTVGAWPTDWVTGAFGAATNGTHLLIGVRVP